MTPATSIQVLLSVLLWTALGVYGFSSLWWLVETFVLSHGWESENTDAWGLDDIQVRILTIDAEPVVQQTVNAIPDGLTDVRVVAETDIAINGATVHVVPEEFTCDATNKGRAVEWAQRNVGCDREYVLYLDEDTIVTDFTGLPDADFVQFTEKPIYTAPGWRTSARCSGPATSSSNSGSTGCRTRCTRGAAGSPSGTTSNETSGGTSRRLPRTRTSSGAPPASTTSSTGSSTPGSGIRLPRRSQPCSSSGGGG